jgi:hypothetical protein
MNARTASLSLSSSLALLVLPALFGNCTEVAGPDPRSGNQGAALTEAVLGSATHFAVLAGSAVTNTGPTTIEGNLGLYPGLAGSLTGFPPGLVSLGTTHAGDALALQAQTDLTATYVSLAGLPCGMDLTGKDLGGMTLTPGVYCFSSSAQLTGTLQLDAQNVGTGVFVFQIGSSLTTASNSVVSVINAASPCNVSWQVGSSATLGTGSTMVGHVLALTSITVTTGARVTGNVLARDGAVTLDSNDINQDGCLDTARAMAGDGGVADGGGFACTNCNNTACVDLSSDANNCGACGTVCALTYCVGGSCSPTCE